MQKASLKDRSNNSSSTGRVCQCGKGAGSCRRCGACHQRAGTAAESASAKTGQCTSKNARPWPAAPVASSLERIGAAYCSEDDDVVADDHGEELLDCCGSSAFALPNMFVGRLFMGALPGSVFLQTWPTGGRNKTVPIPVYLIDSNNEAALWIPLILLYSEVSACVPASLPTVYADAHAGRVSGSVANRRAEPAALAAQPVPPLGATYTGGLVGRLEFRVNGQLVESLDTRLGSVPIMVRSRVCRLFGKSGAELVAAHEEPQRGRRRNYPISVCRPSFVKKGKWFSDKAVIVRCVTTTRRQFYAPVGLLLRALFDGSPAEMYQAIVLSHTALAAAAALLYLQSSDQFKTRQSVLKYIGHSFRQKLRVPADASDLDCGRHLMQRSVLTHCDSDADKFYLLCLMLRANCTPAYVPVLRDILYRWLLTLQRLMEKKLAKAQAGNQAAISDAIKTAVGLCSHDITAAMENFMATGNLNSQSLLLLQNTGLVWWCPATISIG
uniref:DNA-directed RNA polymerase n=1 Tax=Macrostomum lignano TaxID=282301 RepID=A0A1I8F8V7_9PLAT